MGVSYISIRSRGRLGSVREILSIYTRRINRSVALS